MLVALIKGVIERFTGKPKENACREEHTRRYIQKSGLVCLPGGEENSYFIKNAVNPSSRKRVKTLISPVA